MTLPTVGKQVSRPWPVASVLDQRGVRHAGNMKGAQMTDLDVRGSRPAVDLEFFRHELEEQRQFRLDQLTKLAYNAETTTDEALAEVNATLRGAASTVLAQIDAALFRLAIGSFGVCQRCGSDISQHRLHALPMASLCLRCEYANESPHRASTASDIVELWGVDSFPASDPPANW
jgi:RNA polymerase-binding transcription factor DksA